MLSRVAENLYWMARYLERAENTARLINSTTQVLLDLPRGASFGWDLLLKAVGLDNLYAQHHSQADEAGIMRFLIADPKNPGSLLASIQHARENARTFREVLPMEVWERINGLYLYIRDNAERATQGRSRRYEVLKDVIERRQSIIGLLQGSMSRDLAYQFIELGLNLERADMTTRILDVNSAVRLPEGAAGHTARQRLWMNTLNALSAYQMYRQHLGVHVEEAEVVAFLLKDPHFPRTVAFCLNELENCLSVLINPQQPLRAARHAWQQLVGLNLGAQPARLHDALDQIQQDLNELHKAITQQYFHLHNQAPLMEQSLAQ